MNPDVAASTLNPRLENVRLRLDRILVALDLTEQDANTFKTAVTLARNFASELIVFHAVENPAYQSSILGGVRETDSAESEFSLHRLVREAKVPGHLPVIFDIVEERMPAAIYAAIERHRAQLVVMHCDHDSAAARVVAGSKSEEILRTISVPAVVTGPKARALQRPWNQVLLATDLAPDALRPVQYAIGMAEQTEARLLMLHVMTDGKNTERDIEARSVTRHAYEMLPDEAVYWCRPSARVAFGEPSAEVLRLATDIHPDLIVTGLRDSDGLGEHSRSSITSRIIRGAPCPVLAVPNHIR